MPGVVDEVSGRQVEILLAVDVCDRAALCLGYDHGLTRWMRPRTHHVLLVSGFDGLGGAEVVGHVG